MATLNSYRELRDIMNVRFATLHFYTNPGPQEWFGLPRSMQISSRDPLLDLSIGDYLRAHNVDGEVRQYKDLIDYDVINNVTMWDHLFAKLPLREGSLPVEQGVLVPKFDGFEIEKKVESLGVEHISPAKAFFDSDKEWMIDQWGSVDDKKPAVKGAADFGWEQDDFEKKIAEFVDRPITASRPFRFLSPFDPPRGFVNEGTKSSPAKAEILPSIHAPRKEKEKDGAIKKKRLPRVMILTFYIGEKRHEHRFNKFDGNAKAANMTAAQWFMYEGFDNAEVRKPKFQQRNNLGGPTVYDVVNDEKLLKILDEQNRANGPYGQLYLHAA